MQTAAVVVIQHPGRLGGGGGGGGVGSIDGGGGVDSFFAGAAPSSRFTSPGGDSGGGGTGRPGGAAGAGASVSGRRYERLWATSERPGDGSVVFLRSAREIKATVGGLDTVGIEHGGGILDRSAAKLREVMPAAAADTLMERFAGKVDANDAAGHWWTSQDDVDTPAELSERMVGRSGGRGQSSNED